MTDEDRIKAGEWVPCRLCEDAFRRKRETRRFCHICPQAACEGEHGNFAKSYGTKHPFTCIICGAPKDYATRQKANAQVA